MEKYIGKVILVVVPNSNLPKYRWIIKKRDDGRYIARVPKIGVLIRELDKKRDNDYGKEILLPIGTKPHNSSSVTRKSRKKMRKFSKKTRKN